MTTPGPRTRSQARAEAVAGQLFSVGMPKSRSAAADAGTPNASDALLRHGSLIPAYHFEDRVEDLSLERMLGTPFTVELKQRTKKAAPKPTPAVEQESSFISVDLSAEEAVSEEPVPQEAPPAVDSDSVDVDTTDADAIEALQITEVPEIAEDDGLKLASALDALELGEEGEEGEELVAGGPLRGVPAPTGTHIRFDDEDEDDTAASSGALVLKGVPPPEGRHVRFDDDA